MGKVLLKIKNQMDISVLVPSKSLLLPKTNCCLLLKSYIVSDCDSVRVMNDSHGYTAEDAIAASIKAGN